tara:strand:- start:4570 stop:4719 length:150 start_codon:yes stop_codon:yes gene_type:complete
VRIVAAARANSRTRLYLFARRVLARATPAAARRALPHGTEPIASHPRAR